MARIDGGFNPDDEIDVSNPVPSGEYTMVILDSEIKTSQSGGKYMSLTHQIVDGPYKDRRIWNNLNLWHEKDQARNMARSSLKQLCYACGIRRVVSDTEELHNIPFRALVDVQPAKDGFQSSNRIMKYLAEGDVATTKQATQKASNAAKNSDAAPWERN
jgi:hypothetical protein